MKIALCLYGHLGLAGLASTRSHNNLLKESTMANKISFKTLSSLNKYLFSEYDTDTFMHCWSVDQEDQVKIAYSPIESMFENQISFTSTLEDYGIVGDKIEDWNVSDSAKYGYELMLVGRPSRENFIEALRQEVFRSNSRWYSTKRSIELKQNYEMQHGFEYDYTIVSRFDCVFKSPFKLNLLKSDKFYATPRRGRKDLNYALQDFWFMSNTKNMKTFATLHDNIQDYCIRPTFACREHIKKHIGEEKIEYMFNHNVDYEKG